MMTNFVSLTPDIKFIKCYRGMTVPMSQVFHCVHRIFRNEGKGFVQHFSCVSKKCPLD